MLDGCLGAPYRHSCHRRQRCSYPSRSVGDSEVAAEAAVGGAVGAGTQDEGRSRRNPERGTHCTRIPDHHLRSDEHKCRDERGNPVSMLEGG